MFWGRNFDYCKVYAVLKITTKNPESKFLILYSKLYCCCPV